MKNVLILYPGLAGRRASYLAPHRLRLKLAGIRLLLADDTITAEDEKLFAATIELPPAERYGEAKDALRRFLDARKCDAILAQSEHGLLLGAHLARERDLPGASPKGALATTSKLLSRRALNRAGIDQPQFTVARNALDVRRFAQEHGYPVVLKAIASSRQRLVTFVSSAAEVESAVATVLGGLAHSLDIQRLVSYCRVESADAGADPLSEFLVESYVTGDVLECDGLMQGRELHSLGVVEQIPHETLRFFIRGYQIPAMRPTALLDRMERLAAQATHALEMRDTGYSIEFRVDGDRPRLIEVNGRLGWDEGFSEMFTAACGAPPALFAAKVALGKTLGNVHAKRSAAVAYGYCEAQATVMEVPTAQAIRKLHKRGIDCEIYVSRGEQLLAADHPDSRPHVSHALATDPHSSAAAFARASAAVEELDISLTPAQSTQIPSHA